jgi:hypothetical protein
MNGTCGFIFTYLHSVPSLVYVFGMSQSTYPIQSPHPCLAKLRQTMTLMLCHQWFTTAKDLALDYMSSSKSYLAAIIKHYTTTVKVKMRRLPGDSLTAVCARTREERMLLVDLGREISRPHESWRIDEVKSRRVLVSGTSARNFCYTDVRSSDKG